ncbi:hypothetical protein SAMN06265222_1011011 [Neorhodopirellula lusitana]|uniref:Secreted protein n=1 Tax=Neorhodopirellula lusitana TaxID=445327 RepID=A0ABY1PRG8_9BACT|nr:hypothetical protein SAMN06265222_1011011 [Neorhodopirellula lusitana]
MELMERWRELECWIAFLIALQTTGSGRCKASSIDRRGKTLVVVTCVGINCTAGFVLHLHLKLVGS